MTAHVDQVYEIPASTALPDLPEPDEPAAATFVRLVAAHLPAGTVVRLHYRASGHGAAGAIAMRSAHGEFRVAHLTWTRDHLVFDLDQHGYGPTYDRAVPGLTAALASLHRDRSGMDLVLAHDLPAAYARDLAAGLQHERVHFAARLCAGCGWHQPYVRHRDQLCRSCRGANRDPLYPRTPAARRDYRRRLRAAAADADRAARGELTLFDLLTHPL